MIIATPLDLPSIEPDDWSVFWKIWHQHSKNLIKISDRNNPNSYSKVGDDTKWQGLDIYKNYNFKTVWEAPFYDIKNELPKLYDQLLNLPFKRLYRVRIIESKCSILSHSDDFRDQWSVRAFFKLDDPESQWYFTKPGPDNPKTYLRMPTQTNWFAYNDKYCWHGSTYNTHFPKLLLQIYHFENISFLIENSIGKYQEYTINL
jgi:hypothetical protein